MLSSSTNESKNDEELVIWVKEKNINLSTQIIPENVSLDFKDFEAFIQKRKELLVKTIKSIIGV